MKRTLTTIAAAALASAALVPAAVAQNDGPKPKQVASEICHQQKEEMGNKAFKELYGGKHAMQTCKRQNRDEAEEAIANAAQECKEEREAMGQEAFAGEYGRNENGRNAFGKCVSEKVHEDEEPEAAPTA